MPLNSQPTGDSLQELACARVPSKQELLQSAVSFLSHLYVCFHTNAFPGLCLDGNNRAALEDPTDMGL